MLTFEDCLSLSELTEEEILAIAEHEHIPELAALELGSDAVFQGYRLFHGVRVHHGYMQWLSFGNGRFHEL